MQYIRDGKFCVSEKNVRMNEMLRIQGKHYIINKIVRTLVNERGREKGREVKYVLRQLRKEE